MSDSFPSVFAQNEDGSDTVYLWDTNGSDNPDDWTPWGTGDLGDQSWDEFYEDFVEGNGELENLTPFGEESGSIEEPLDGSTSGDLDPADGGNEGGTEDVGDEGEGSGDGAGDGEGDGDGGDDPEDPKDPKDPGPPPDSQPEPEDEPYGPSTNPGAVAGNGNAVLDLVDQVQEASGDFAGLDPFADLPPDADPFGQSTERGEPVQLFSGAFTRTEVDISLPARGAGFRLRRHYHAHFQAEGVLGPRWSLDFEDRLWMFETGAVYLVAADGSGVVFRPQSDDPTILRSEAIPETALFEEGLLDAWGKEIRPGRIRIVSPDGAERTYVLYGPQGRRRGRLTKVAARDGHGTRYERNDDGRVEAIEDSAGRRFVLIYDGDRLTRVSSGIDLVRYEYDAGRLSRVTWRAAVAGAPGPELSYTYHDGSTPGAWSCLQRVIDAGGTVLLENEYDEAPRPRVVGQTFEGGVLSYAYGQDGDRRTTRVVDRAGAETIYLFDELGRLLETHVRLADGAGGAADAVTRYTYGAAGRIEKIVFPEGNGLELGYADADEDPARRANLMSMRSVGADGAAVLEESYLYGPFNVPTRVTDARGVVGHDVDPNTGDVWEIDLPAIETSGGVRRSPIIKWTYDVRRLPETRTDPGGLTLRFSHDARGLPLGSFQVVADDERLLQGVTRDDLGRVVGEQSTGGATLAYERDLRGNVVRVTRNGTLAREFTYDLYDRLVLAREYLFDETGAPAPTPSIDTTIVRDPYGRVIAMALEAGGQTLQRIEYTLDGEGRVTAQTGLGVRPRAVKYDERGLVREVIVAPGTPSAVTLRYGYDRNGNVTSIENGRGLRTTFAYDGADRAVVETDASGCREEIHYSGIDDVSAIDRFDPGGVRRFAMRAERDGAGNLKSRSIANLDDAGQAIDWIVEKVELDVEGNAVAHLTGAGEAARSTFDAFGNETGRVDPLGNDLAVERDERGRPISITRDERLLDGSVGRIQRWLTWDVDDHLTQVKDSAGRIETFAYDSRGLLVARTLGDGTAIRVERDPLGRAVVNRVVDASGAEQWRELYEYHPTGELAAVTDALGRKTSLRYDDAGRLIELQRPHERLWMRLERDGNGNVARQEDGLGTVVTQTFDALDRVVERSITGASTGATWERFAYDVNGNLTRAQNAFADVEQLHDSRGLLIRSTAGDQVTTRAYDANGLLRTHTYPSGFALRFEYDALQRPTSVLAEGATVDVRPPMRGTTRLAALAYDGRSLVAQIAANNGLTTSLRHDALGRPLVSELRGAAGALHAQVVLHDAADRVLVSAVAGAPARAFAHDTLGRLVAATTHAAIADVRTVLAAVDLLDATNDPTAQAKLVAEANRIAGTATIDRSGWRHDAVGNVLTQSEPTGDVTFQVDDRDELTARNGQPLSWDAAGDLTGDGAFDYRYDFARRLCRVADRASGRVVYEADHDALGRAVRVRQGSDERRLVSDGGRPIEERDAAGKLVALHVWNPATGDLLAFVHGHELLYAHTDLGRNVALVTSAAGRVAQRIEYAPQGARRTTDANGAPARPLTPFGFHGARHVDGLPLARVGERALHVEWGRFIQPDPGGFIDGMNPYLHCAGDPVSRIDLDGRSGTLTGTAIGAAWGVGWGIGTAANAGIYSATDGYWGEKWKGIDHVASQAVQFTASGALIGASFDARLIGGGAVSATLGGMGVAGAMSAFDGSWSGFAHETVEGGAIGFGMWGAGRLAAPVVAPVASWLGGTAAVQGLRAAATPLLDGVAAGLATVRGWIEAEGGAAAKALAKAPVIGQAVEEAGEGMARATQGPWNMFGRQWRLIMENKDGSRSLFGGDRFKYGWKNLINESRLGREGFDRAVSPQYWRGTANGNSLQHLFFTSSGPGPEWFKNAGLNQMEIPKALNSWAGGIPRREWGIRLCTMGLAGVVGLGSYFAGTDLQDALNQQDGTKSEGC